MVGKDGFVLWTWCSDALLETGCYLQPRKKVIPLPSRSLAVCKEPPCDILKGVTHDVGVWPFKEPVREMAMKAPAYDMTLSLLLFPSDGCALSRLFSQLPILPRKKLVGVTGFEPATYCSQSSRATRLRYTPNQLSLCLLLNNKNTTACITVFPLKTSE